eukprot:3558476-Prymnesium_polylepis.1
MATPVASACVECVWKARWRPFQKAREQQLNEVDSQRLWQSARLLCRQAFAPHMRFLLAFALQVRAHVEGAPAFLCPRVAGGRAPDGVRAAGGRAMASGRLEGGRWRLCGTHRCACGCFRALQVGFVVLTVRVSDSMPFSFDVSWLEWGYLIWVGAIYLSELGQAAAAVRGGELLGYLRDLWNVIDLLILGLLAAVISLRVSLPRRDSRTARASGRAAERSERSARSLPPHPARARVVRRERLCVGHAQPS